MNNLRLFLQIIVQNKYILFLTLATLIKMSGLLTGIINWGGFPKLLFSLLLWFSVFSFPYKKFNLNSYAFKDYLLIIILIILSLISILRVPFEDSSIYNNAMYGNKYISWIFNELSILLFFPMLFIGLSTNKIENLKIRMGICICIFANLLFSLYSPHISSAILMLLPFVYPYLKKNKFILAAALFLLTLKGLNIIGLARISTFYLIFVITSFYFSKHNKYIDTIIKIYVFIIIFIPIYFIFDSLHENTSIFSQLTTISHNESLTEDTRTFLYKEVISDLRTNDAILLGKGSHSFYETDFFSSRMGIDYRNAVEVPILNFWLKAGLLYCIVFSILLLRAIYLAVWKSKNRYIQIIGCFIADIYLTMFVGDINGCTILQCTLWMMVGICLSPRLRNLKEYEINNFFYK